MNKDVLRKVYLGKRCFLDIQEYEKRNAGLCGQVFQNIDFSKVKCIHTFLPIGKYKEVNTWLIIEALMTNYPEVQIVVPKTDPKNLKIINYILEEKSQLGVNKWGIPEPLWGKTIENTKIDCILVPLICFDRKGHRIGYGKGYYDRFLAACREGVSRIGLSLSPPLDEIPYIGQYDIPLDSCLSPYGNYLF